MRLSTPSAPIELNIATEIAPKGEALNAALALAEKILANGQLAVRMAKRVIDEGLEASLPTALSLEMDSTAHLFVSDDKREGIQAFVEKRAAAFQRDSEEEPFVIELRGSTWDHTRGYAPLPATAEAYSAAHPDVRIVWEKRTLRDFAEMSLPQLAQRYDLIVLDHPWIGACVAAGSLLPLDGFLSAEFLTDQAQQQRRQELSKLQFRRSSVGAGGRCRLAGQRLSPGFARSVRNPANVGSGHSHWRQRLKRDGKCEQSRRRLMHVDCFPCFFSLCANAGEQAFMDGEAVRQPPDRTSCSRHDAHAGRHRAP